MENVKLILEYDGTRYVGWQVQPNGPSIQGELETALRQILQETISVTGAGRTDSGVHARGQVASFKVARPVQPHALAKSLNAVLPHDIVVISAENVPEDFNARYSARSRLYRYYLSLRPTAVQREYSWYVGGYRIDTGLLNNCAARVLGAHDFSSFCKSDTSADQLSCVVESSKWSNSDSSMVYEISANRFLYGMVRALVGTMIEIGRGHRSCDEFDAIMQAKDRAKAGMSAPARGLFLEEVIY